MPVHLCQGSCSCLGSHEQVVAQRMGCILPLRSGADQGDACLRPAWPSRLSSVVTLTTLTTSSLGDERPAVAGHPSATNMSFCRSCAAANRYERQRGCSWSREVLQAGLPRGLLHSAPLQELPQAFAHAGAAHHQDMVRTQGRPEAFPVSQQHMVKVLQTPRRLP